MTETKQANIGAVPAEVVNALDNAFDKLCILLREHGKEIIPKKMLYSAAIYNFLNPFLDCDTEQAKKKAVEELISNVKRFWKEHGGNV